INIQLERIKRNLDALEVFFDKFSDLFTWVKPKAGSICFPRLFITQSSLDFCENIIKDAGIMILPSTVYNFGESHIRIGFGRENLIDVLLKFEEYLQSL
ncbi:MAG: aspartate aminotransferase, partial [Candidatus Hodarchaeota archaeon]